MSTNTLMPQVQRLFPHYVIFISHYFKPVWFNLIKLRLIEWWWFGWWFQRVNSFFQQIHKSCLHFLHYLYSVEFYVFIRHTGFNGVAIMFRFSIFTTRRNVYICFIGCTYVTLTCIFPFHGETFIIHSLPVWTRPFQVLFFLKQFNNSKRTFSDCFISFLFLK